MGRKDLSEADIRNAVREDVAAGGLRVIATVCWTLVAGSTCSTGVVLNIIGDATE